MKRIILIITLGLLVTANPTAQTGKTAIAIMPLEGQSISVDEATSLSGRLLRFLPQRLAQMV